MESFIKGLYKKSLFQGDNGYVVGLFKIKETDPDNEDLIGETVVFTGYFHELNDSDTYILNGKFSLAESSVKLPEISHFPSVMACCTTGELIVSPS